MIDSCFLQRRLQLLNQMPDDSVAIVSSGFLSTRNRDSEFPFRVDSDFWYLTGLDEPKAILVLEKISGDFTSHIFIQEKNTKEEIWAGKRLGVDAATQQLGVDKAHSSESFSSMLSGLLKGKKVVLSIYGQDHISQAIQSFFSSRRSSRCFDGYANTWQDLSVILHPIRLIKRPEEIDLMRQAAMISSLGHIQMMRATRPGRYEYQLAATMQYESMMQGAVHQAYSPIVASGVNACTLHYNDNNAKLKKGDLVLIDAGCEFGFYASDITRTFPVDGNFSTWQKSLYQIVLDAQKAAIASCISGKSFNAVHDSSVSVICTGLVDLGLFKESIDQVIEEKLYRRYFMHGTSHWLGLDVHDVGCYTQQDGNPIILQPGMVLTVEPGLYIPENDQQSPEEWRGTGIRIEDDVHITKDKPEIISLASPKEIDDMIDIIGQESGRKL